MGCAPTFEDTGKTMIKWKWVVGYNNPIEFYKEGVHQSGGGIEAAARRRKELRTRLYIVLREIAAMLKGQVLTASSYRDLDGNCPVLRFPRDENQLDFPAFKIRCDEDWLILADNLEDRGHTAVAHRLRRRARSLIAERDAVAAAVDESKF
jgi:hypothetical protein